MFDKQIFKFAGARLCCVFVAVLSLCKAFAIIGVAWFLGRAIVDVWQGASFEMALPSLSLGIVCFVLRQVFSCFVDVVSRQFSDRVVSSLFDSYTTALYTRGVSAFDKHGTTGAVLDISQGFLQVRTYLAFTFPKVIALVVVPVCICVAVACNDLISAAICIVCFPFIVLFMRLIGHTASDDAARRMSKFKAMSGHFADTVAGISTLVAYGRARSYEGAVRVASEGFRKASERTIRIASLSGAVLDLFATCALAGVAIMLGFRLADGSMQFFPAIVCLMLVPEFFLPVRTYAADYHASLDGKSALANILKVVEGKGSPSNAVAEGCDAALRATNSKLFVAGAAGSKLGTDDAQLADVVCELRDVSFSYSKDLGHDKDVVKHVSIKLHRGDFLVISGHSGVGKSTLLDIVAGLRQPTSGQIIYYGDKFGVDKWRSCVAYIPQRPFIFAGSIAQNVAFYNPSASKEQILDALDVVGLGEVVAHLPQKEETQVGEGGLELSGGEAHRLALARAVCAQERDVWVLDEPTAHLDEETEQELKQVFLELARDKCVVMATHRGHWREQATCVLKLGEQLPGDAFVARVAGDCTLEVLHTGGQHEVVESQYCKDVLKQRGLKSSVAVKKQGWLEQLVRSHLVLGAACVLLGTLGAGFSGALMFTSGFMISAAACVPATVLVLHLPSIFVRIFGVGRPCISYIERNMSHSWVLRATSDLRVRLYRAVSASASSFGSKLGMSNAISVMSECIEDVQNMALRGVFPVCVSLLLFVVCCVGAFAMSLKFGLWTLLVIGCVVLIFSTMRVCVSRKSTRGLRCALKELYRNASDGASGIRDWQLSGREADFSVQLSSPLEDVIKAARKRENIAHYFGIASQVAFALFELGLFAFVVTKFFPGAQGAISSLADNQGFAYAPNWIAAFVLLAFPLFEHFSAVGDAACDFDLRRGSLDELSKIEDDSIKTATSSAKFDTQQAVGRDVGSGVAVSLQNVDFGFMGAQSMLFEGLDLEIKQGEWVAVVGRSGVGKTSLARLIIGEFAPLHGKVLVCGQDPRLVKNAAVVEQTPHIFDTTLRENLLVANGRANDEQIKQALCAVGLGVLLNREGGLDAKLVLDGANVSGGQRQRIALARAFISEAPVVLLDEPFAAVDPELEAQLLETMKSAFANKTLICITHHKDNLQAFSRVIKLRWRTIF